MNCRMIAPLLAACIDGETTAEEKARVDAHLGECPECRSKYERMKKTDGFLSAGIVGGSLPCFETRLLERIRRKESIARPFLDMIRIEKKLIVAFAALLIILSAVAYNRHVVDPSGTYTELQRYVTGGTSSSGVMQVASSSEMVSYLVND